MSLDVVSLSDGRYDLLPSEGCAILLPCSSYVLSALFANSLWEVLRIRLLAVIGLVTKRTVIFVIPYIWKYNKAVRKIFNIALYTRFPRYITDHVLIIFLFRPKANIWWSSSVFFNYFSYYSTVWAVIKMGTQLTFIASILRICGCVLLIYIIKNFLEIWYDIL